MQNQLLYQHHSTMHSVVCKNILCKLPFWALFRKLKTDSFWAVLCVFIVQTMLIFPEILEKKEVEELNQMAEEVERFFTEKGWHLEDKYRLSASILIITIVL